MRTPDRLLQVGAVVASVLSVVVLWRTGEKDRGESHALLPDAGELDSLAPESRTKLTRPSSGVPMVRADAPPAARVPIVKKPASPRVLEQKAIPWVYHGRVVDAEGEPLANLLIGGRRGRRTEFLQESFRESKPHWIPRESIPLVPLDGECFTGPDGCFKFTTPGELEHPYALHQNGEFKALPVKPWRVAGSFPEELAPGFRVALGDVKVVCTPFFELEFLQPDGGRETFGMGDCPANEPRISRHVGSGSEAARVRIELFEGEELLGELSGEAYPDGIFRVAFGHLDARAAGRGTRMRVRPPGFPVIERSLTAGLLPSQRHTCVLPPTLPLRLRVAVCTEVRVPEKHSPRFVLQADVAAVKPSWPVAASGLGAQCALPMKSGVWDIDLPVLDSRAFALELGTPKGWGVAEWLKDPGPLLPGGRRHEVTVVLRTTRSPDPPRLLFGGCGGSYNPPQGQLRVLDLSGKKLSSCSVDWQNGVSGLLYSGKTWMLDGEPRGTCVVTGMGRTRSGFRGTQLLELSSQTLSGTVGEYLDVEVRLEAWQETVVQIRGLSALERSLVPAPSLRASPEAAAIGVRLPDSNDDTARWSYRVNAGTWRLRSSSILFGGLNEELELGNRTGPQVFSFEVD